MRRIAAEAKPIVEPLCATALAGVLAMTGVRADPAVAVLSGGNLDPETLAAILTEA